MFKAENASTNGEVTINVPYTKTDSKNTVEVYYVSEEDGTRTNMNAKYEDGVLTWTTNHFSMFAVVEKAGSVKPDDTKPGDTTKPADSTKPATKPADAKKPPRTGDESHAALWLAVALLGGCAAVGTTVIAKKRNYTR